MNKLRSLLGCALLLGSVAVAQAVTYTDTNWHGTFLTQGQSKDGTFDLKPAYDPASEQITSASVTFTFLDDVLSDTIVLGWKFIFPILGQEGEAGTISLNGEQIASESSSGLWIFAGLTYGVPGDILLSLSNTGVLDYTIKSTQGDFYFKTATLVAEASARAVPDGGTTVALLGASLLGLAALRRRFAK